MPTLAIRALAADPILPSVPPTSLAGALGTHAVAAPVQRCAILAVPGRWLVIRGTSWGGAPCLEEQQQQEA